MKRLFYISLIFALFASAVLSGCNQQSTKIRVATDATWPPFEYVDEGTTNIVGFDIDVFNAIAAKENLDIEFINVGFDPLLAGVAQCQYDAAISSITITDERKQSMLFSDPYFTAGQVIVVQVGNTDITTREDLVGKNVGAQIGTTGALEVQAIEGATLKTYDDIGLAFQDLMNGQVDAVVADDALAKGYVNQNSDKIVIVGEPMTNEAYGIAVCNDNQELLDKINSGLAAIKADGTLDELVTKWFVNQ